MLAVPSTGHRSQALSCYLAAGPQVHNLTQNQSTIRVFITDSSIVALQVKLEHFAPETYSKSRRAHTYSLLAAGPASSLTAQLPVEAYLCQRY